MDLLAGRLDIPELHAEEHQIDGADCGGVVGRLDRAHDRLATVALHSQAVGSHGRQMRAARKEGYILPRSRERSAERGADAPGADYRNAHAKLLPIGLIN